MSMVAGIFREEEAVHSALEALLAQHYSPSQISLLVSERHQRDEVAIKHTDNIATGASIGAITGALLGATLVATGVLVGPWALLGAGPVLQAIGGAAAGAAAGTAYGAFAGMGSWGEVADLHAKELGEGAVWIGVQAEGREADAEETLRQHGALHITHVEG